MYVWVKMKINNTKQNFSILATLATVSVLLFQIQWLANSVPYI